MKVIQKFECPVCYAKYEDFSAAEKCCPARLPRTVWVCGNCKTPYSVKSEAEKCCPGQAEDKK